MKKIVSLCITFLMILTSFPMLSLSANAEETNLTVTQELVGETADLSAAPDAADIEASDLAEIAAETAPAPELEQEEVSYPQITDIQNVSNGVRLRWDSFGSGSTYRVYYREAAVYSGSWDEEYASSGWTRLASVTGTEYVHQGVKSDWYSILTLKDGRVKGIEPQPPIMSDFQSLSAYRRSQPVRSSSRAVLVERGHV